MYEVKTKTGFLIARVSDPNDALEWRDAWTAVFGTGAYIEWSERR